MQPNEYGIEGVVAEDGAYSGSRFSEVRDAVFGQPYPGTFDGDGRMPIYPVTLRNMVHGLLGMPFGRKYLWRQAVARTVDSHADLRWGPDRRGFQRLVHPNGICLSGVWEITEPTEYSGYFATSSKALIVARYSTCCTETRRGHGRSLSMAGKLFPTTDAQHAVPLRTASFLTQQDIGGDYTNYINDVELRNAPNTSGWRRGSGLPILLIVGAVFKIVDREPAIRQLYDIAELGLPSGQATRAPTFMRLLVAPDQPRIKGEGLDFRDEIMRQIFDPGDPVPKRTLRFNIEVTDDGEVYGPALAQRRSFSNWRRIGGLTFDNVAASYNGDFVLHFHHPTWRTDRNDPSAGTRVDGRKR
jgi:hypothetical protein